MEDQKNNKGVITLLIVIIVILSALCVLFATGTISFKSNEIVTNEDNQNIVDNNTNQEKQNTAINKDELTKINSSDYNIIKDVNNSNYSFKLDIDGRININFENYLSNISNAKDILLFSPPSPISTLYILTNDGDIYKYQTSSYDEKNYNATKIEQYSNITMMFNYKIRRAYAGGCDYIILVDNNGNYIELDSYCI